MVEKSDYRDFIDFCNHYNPVSQFVIKPSLRLVNAHEHKIRGGLAAALSFGIVHYALLDLSCRAFNYLNLTDMRTTVWDLPDYKHYLIGSGMLLNFSLGVLKNYQQKNRVLEERVNS